jgi:hypothetical protein
VTVEAQFSREQDLDQLRKQIRQKIEQARIALQAHRCQEAAGGDQPGGSLVIEADDPRIRRRRYYS